MDDDPLNGPRVIVWVLAVGLLALLGFCFWMLDR